MQGGGCVLRFLSPGPYPDFKEKPQFKPADFISDEEAADAVNYIFGGMMNAFKGALAELLAVGPVAQFVSDLQSRGRIPEDAQLFVGDTVLAPHTRGLTRKRPIFTCYA